MVMPNGMIWKWRCLPLGDENDFEGNIVLNFDHLNQCSSNLEDVSPVLIEVSDSPNRVNTHIRFRSPEPGAEADDMKIDNQSPHESNKQDSHESGSGPSSGRLEFQTDPPSQGELQIVLVSDPDASAQGEQVP
ncbi:hypothetical protein L2E82_46029 [Cichorium intybus]|uniref:Uncharacterized protein n=1 Tax=Cichorium intybus TaxID=13427 RepID=A0ACB8YRS4_CICIN|nr:hypothetical protein L2E82_46029 [Cichorium intybus]